MCHISCVLYVLFQFKVVLRRFSPGSLEKTGAKFVDRLTGSVISGPVEEHNTMRGREIFGRYRQLVEELSNERASDDAWFEVLQAIVRRLDHDSAELAGTGAGLLYDRSEERRVGQECR